MRKYIRHPTSIPIEYSISDISTKKENRVKNIGFGGLCFKSDRYIEKGKILTIKIPVVSPTFEIKGRVVWCVQNNNYVETGVEFINPKDIFKTRMIEQICYIKHYQKEVKEKQGRKLADEVAATEWISIYGNNFPK